MWEILLLLLCVCFFMETKKNNMGGGSVRNLMGPAELDGPFND